MTLYNKAFDIIKSSPLMDGLDAEDVKVAINCFTIDMLECPKNSSPSALKYYSGIIIEGALDIVALSYQGDEHIISRLSAGSYIPNELLSSNSISTPFIPMVSKKNCRILLIDQEKIRRCNCSVFQCTDEKQEHHCPLDPILLSRINYNMVVLLNDILMSLSEKLQILTQKTLSEKLNSYFQMLATKNGTTRFTLPFNRDELAKYISAERSSVSREINHMKDQQLIRLYSSNDIELLNLDAK